MQLTRIVGALAVLSLVGAAVYAEEYGTPAEAKAMLETRKSKRRISDFG